MAIYNKRVKFSKQNLIDHYMIRNSLTDLIYGLLRLIGIIIQNIYCVSSYLVLSWIVLLPISWIKSDLYSKAENYLYNSLLFIVSSWSLAAGATIVETGDEYKHLIEETDNNSSSNKVNVSIGNVELTNNKEHHITNGYCNYNGIKNNTKILTSEDKSLNPRFESTLKDETDRINTNNLKPNNINTNNNTKNSNLSGDQTNIEKSENDLISINDGLDTIDCSRINNNRNDSNLSRKFRKNCINDSRVQQKSNDQHQQTTNNNVSQLITTNIRNSTKKPRVLLLCNHISTADVPLIMQSFSTLTNQSILWVLDAQVSS